jgi:hypothetical protein
MSLALLVVGVIDHGSLNIDCSGAAPNSSGLVRLGRDLMRVSGGKSTAAAGTVCQLIVSATSHSRAGIRPQRGSLAGDGAAELSVPAVRT